MSYTLFCIVLGEGTTFSVKVDETQSVDELKDKIKKKNAHRFNVFDAYELTLHKLASDVDSNQSEVEDIKRQLFDLTKQALNPMDKLATILSDTANLERIVHILVVPPQRVATSHPSSPPLGSPLKHTPPMSDLSLHIDINIILDEYRPRMRALVEQAYRGLPLLQLWKLGSPADSNLATRVSELSIPILSDGRPSLLLHGLGEGTNALDGAYLGRIPDIFTQRHTVLINTSGSGKTRLLLEGLCRRWGFYFVAKPDTSGIGSNDLWSVMKELDNACDYNDAKQRIGRADRDPEAAQAAFTHIQEVVGRRLSQLLLARFLLLDLLVQEAKKCQEGLQPKELRHLWVLLQAQPSLLTPSRDAFHDFTQRLNGASAASLKARIRQQYETLSGLLQEAHDPPLSGLLQEAHNPTLFCVLDEVQITISQEFGRVGEFLSQDKITKRPILRMLWLEWSEALQRGQMNLVLSGTGIELQALSDTLGSTACKQHRYDIVHNIGAFEDKSIQTQYIERYLPEPLDKKRWEDFLIRAWAWFRGRYRSTATLVLLMLEKGYQSPHTTIDEYVEVFTGFRPTDGRAWTHDESPLPLSFIKSRVTELNFQKMNPVQADTLCDILYEQFLYGNYVPNSLTPCQQTIFVEYGFARHRDAETVIDEPLAILAALRWLNQTTEYSLFKRLYRNISKHSTRRNGFEAYLVFYLRTVFQHTPLNAIFTFRSDFATQDWLQEEFDLVTVVDSRNKPQVSVVTPSSGPSSNNGLQAQSGEDVLDWISTNKDQYTFCFPPESFGPDILFFVESKVSKRLLLVLIQAKNYCDVQRAVLLHGVRTVTPAWFWKSKDEEYATANTAPFIKRDDAALAAKAKDILANIQLGLKVKRADYPVLRVFASWPGEAQLDRTLDWKEGQELSSQESDSHGDNIEDPDQHPLAALDLANFEQISAKLYESWFQQDVEQIVVVESKKRAREEEDSKLSCLRKRQRK